MHSITCMATVGIIINRLCLLLTYQLSFVNEEVPVCQKTLSPASAVAGHVAEKETDMTYAEVKHTVQTPFTMEHNLAYSTTTHK